MFYIIYGLIMLNSEQYHVTYTFWKFPIAISASKELGSCTSALALCT